MIRTRRLAVVIALFAAGAAACAPQAPPPPDTAADAAELRRMQDREIAMMTTANVDSMLTVYTADIVMMAPDQPMVVGTDALRAWLTEFMKTATMTGTYSSADVDVAGNTGIVRYAGELTITPSAPRSKPTVTRIKGLHIYKKQADGTWKIAQDVWTTDPALMPATR